MNYLKMCGMCDSSDKFPETKPRDVFHEKLIEFFKRNFGKDCVFVFRDKLYQFSAIEITDEYIFGKIWKLKEKIDKNFTWNSGDYVIEPHVGKDYLFNYFLITLDTHHLVIQDQDDFSSNMVIKILKDWYEKHHNMMDGIDFQYLKSRKEFVKIIKEAHKLVYASFVLYPSNFDSDFLSKPLDEELRRLKIDKLLRIIESKKGVEIDLEKPNLLSSAISQSLRGNGKDPYIKIEDRKGKTKVIKHKIKHIMRQLEETESTIEIKRELIKQLHDVLQEFEDAKRN